MLSIKGKLVAEQTRSYTKKDGTTATIREISINDGYLDNTIVEIPADYKLVVDKDSNVEISGVKASARMWDNSSKSFQFVKVSFFKEKQK